MEYSPKKTAFQGDALGSNETCDSSARAKKFGRRFLSKSAGRVVSLPETAEKTRQPDKLQLSASLVVGFTSDGPSFNLASLGKHCDANDGSSYVLPDNIVNPFKLGSSPFLVCDEEGLSNFEPTSKNQSSPSGGGRESEIDDRRSAEKEEELRALLLSKEGGIYWRLVEHEREDCMIDTISAVFRPYYDECLKCANAYRKSVQHFQDLEKDLEELQSKSRSSEKIRTLKETSVRKKWERARLDLESSLRKKKAKLRSLEEGLDFERKLEHGLSNFDQRRDLPVSKDNRDDGDDDDDDDFFSASSRSSFNDGRLSKKLTDIRTEVRDAQSLSVCQIAETRRKISSLETALSLGEEEVFASLSASDEKRNRDGKENARETAKTIAELKIAMKEASSLQTKMWDLVNKRDSKSIAFNDDYEEDDHRNGSSSLAGVELLGTYLSKYTKNLFLEFGHVLFENRSEFSKTKAKGDCGGSGYDEDASDGSEAVRNYLEGANLKQGYKNLKTALNFCTMYQQLQSLRNDSNLAYQTSREYNANKIRWLERDHAVDDGISRNGDFRGESDLHVVSGYQRLPKAGCLSATVSGSLFGIDTKRRNYDELSSSSSYSPRTAESEHRAPKHRKLNSAKEYSLSATIGVDAPRAKAQTCILNEKIVDDAAIPSNDLSKTPVFPPADLGTSVAEPPRDEISSKVGDCVEPAVQLVVVVGNDNSRPKSNPSKRKSATSTHHDESDGSEERLAFATADKEVLKSRYAEKMTSLIGKLKAIAASYEKEKRTAFDPNVVSDWKELERFKREYGVTVLRMDEKVSTGDDVELNFEEPAYSDRSSCGRSTVVPLSRDSDVTLRVDDEGDVEIDIDRDPFAIGVALDSRVKSLSDLTFSPASEQQEISGVEFGKAEGTTRERVYGKVSCATPYFFTGEQHDIFKSVEAATPSPVGDAFLSMLEAHVSNTENRGPLSDVSGELASRIRLQCNRDSENRIDFANRGPTANGLGAPEEKGQSHRSELNNNNNNNNNNAGIDLKTASEMATAAYVVEFRTWYDLQTMSKLNQYPMATATLPSLRSLTEDSLTAQALALSQLSTGITDLEMNDYAMKIYEARERAVVEFVRAKNRYAANRERRFFPRGEPFEFAPDERTTVGGKASPGSYGMFMCDPRRLLNVEGKEDYALVSDESNFLGGFRCTLLNPLWARSDHSTMRRNHVDPVSKIAKVAQSTSSLSSSSSPSSPRPRPRPSKTDKAKTKSLPFSSSVASSSPDNKKTAKGFATKNKDRNNAYDSADDDDDRDDDNNGDDDDGPSTKDKDANGGPFRSRAGGRKRDEKRKQQRHRTGEKNEKRCSAAPLGSMTNDVKGDVHLGHMINGQASDVNYHPLSQSVPFWCIRACAKKAWLAATRPMIDGGNGDLANLLGLEELTRKSDLVCEAGPLILAHPSDTYAAKRPSSSGGHSFSSSSSSSASVVSYASPLSFSSPPRTTTTNNGATFDSTTDKKIRGKATGSGNDAQQRQKPAAKANGGGGKNIRSSDRGTRGRRGGPRCEGGGGDAKASNGHLVPIIDDECNFDVADRSVYPMQYFKSGRIWGPMGKASTEKAPKNKKQQQQQQQQKKDSDQAEDGVFFDADAALFAAPSDQIKPKHVLDVKPGLSLISEVSNVPLAAGGFFVDPFDENADLENFFGHESVGRCTCRFLGNDKCRSCLENGNYLPAHQGVAAIIGGHGLHLILGMHRPDILEDLKECHRLHAALTEKTKGLFTRTSEDTDILLGDRSNDVGGGGGDDDDDDRDDDDDDDEGIDNADRPAKTGGPSVRKRRDPILFSKSIGNVCSVLGKLISHFPETPVRIPSGHLCVWDASLPMGVLRCVVDEADDRVGGIGSLGFDPRYGKYDSSESGGSRSGSTEGTSLGCKNPANEILFASTLSATAGPKSPDDLVGSSSGDRRRVEETGCGEKVRSKKIGATSASPALISTVPSSDGDEFDGNDVPFYARDVTDMTTTTTATTTTANRTHRSDSFPSEDRRGQRQRRQLSVDGDVDANANEDFLSFVTTKRATDHREHARQSWKDTGLPFFGMTVFFAETEKAKKMGLLDCDANVGTFEATEDQAKPKKAPAIPRDPDFPMLHVWKGGDSTTTIASDGEGSKESHRYANVEAKVPMHFNKDVHLAAKESGMGMFGNRRFHANNFVNNVSFSGVFFSKSFAFKGHTEAVGKVAAIYGLKQVQKKSAMTSFRGPGTVGARAPEGFLHASENMFAVKKIPYFGLFGGGPCSLSTVCCNVSHGLNMVGSSGTANNIVGPNDGNPSSSSSSSSSSGGSRLRLQWDTITTSDSTVRVKTVEAVSLATSVLAKVRSGKLIEYASETETRQEYDALADSLLWALSVANKTNTCLFGSRFDPRYPARPLAFGTPDAPIPFPPPAVTILTESDAAPSTGVVSYRLHSAVDENALYYNQPNLWDIRTGRRSSSSGCNPYYFNVKKLFRKKLSDYVDCSPYSFASPSSSWHPLALYSAQLLGYSIPANDDLARRRGIESTLETHQKCGLFGELIKHRLGPVPTLQKIPTTAPDGRYEARLQLMDNVDFSCKLSSLMRSLYLHCTDPQNHGSSATLLEFANKNLKQLLDTHTEAGGRLAPNELWAITFQKFLYSLDVPLTSSGHMVKRNVTKWLGFPFSNNTSDIYASFSHLTFEISKKSCDNVESDVTMATTTTVTTTTSTTTTTTTPTATTTTTTTTMATMATDGQRGQSFQFQPQEELGKEQQQQQQQRETSFTVPQDDRAPSVSFKFNVRNDDEGRDNAPSLPTLLNPFANATRRDVPLQQHQRLPTAQYHSPAKLDWLDEAFCDYVNCNDDDDDNDNNTNDHADSYDAR
jgi:hypothetical protein